MSMRSPESTEKAKRYICEQLRSHGVEMFCSPILIDQMAEQSQTVGSFATIDLIFLIKAHSETNFANWPKGPKKPDQFRRHPLNGLWKAHTVPLSLCDFARNLFNEIGQKWFENKLNRFFADHNGETMNEHLARKLAHLAVIQGLTNRGKRNNLTSGHWLIFSETPCGVIFLCIAHHNEDDSQIFDRVNEAAAVFPNIEFSFS
ncbi:hypothetical protein [Tateyamaria sp.]|uniref:hypothetical protein n=1 Tax=Tateyamaria sp. TaxID=1929288 RepID=UPI00329D39CE